jgi:hypothetical protein
MNLEVTGPTGVTLQVGSATAYQLTGFAFIDTDAVSGPVSVVSGPMSGTTVVSNLGTDLDITPRTAMPLADTAMGTLADVGDSALYSVDVTNAPALLRVVASTSDANGQPVAALLPTGKWADATSAARAVLPSSGTVYVVVFDNGTASGYNFSLAKKAEMLTSAPEAAGTNDTTATALNATALPFLQTGGTLSDAADKDMIKVTLAASGKLHVVAGSADGFTDTQVDVKSNGTTSVLSPAGPVDSGDFACLFAGQCGESVTSPMLAAGTYYVEVSAGPNWDASAKSYTALVYIE